MKKRLVVGLSGASGIPIAVELLKEISKNPEWETHLVMSKGAQYTLEQESDISFEELKSLGSYFHNIDNIGASIASGTFEVEGMIIVPCSMKTVAGIASGYSDNLLLRAADVNLKERRKLVLVARETPLNSIHLENMLKLSNIGVVIMPPMLTYYNEPKTLEDMTNHIVGKLLHEFDIPYNRFRRWNPDNQ